MVEASCRMCSGVGDVIVVLQSLNTSIVVEASCIICSGVGDVIVVL